MQVLKYFIALMFLVAVAAESSAKEELITLETRTGVKQSFLLIKPENPVAAVILFAGGKGALNLNKGVFGPSIGWGNNNFLVRTRKKFAKHGFIVATVDAPSDKQGNDGMYGGYRASSDHVIDIDKVIIKLREISNLPIWLVGTSRGTESVAYLGINSNQKPAGIVLTSSMTERNAKGIPVTELPLENISIPTLITHHQKDGCRFTKPEGATRIKQMLTATPVAELQWFKGGREKSKPCNARSYHGYLGIEDEVVDAIAAFIKINS